MLATPNQIPTKALPKPISGWEIKGFPQGPAERKRGNKTNFINLIQNTMAILNGIISNLKGSAGSLTFQHSNGMTIVREKITSITNPRSEGQMRTRTKFTNIVAMYRGIRPLLNQGFENKPAGLSDYNMFVKVNMQRSPIYLTKQAVAGGACIATSYQITQGSLPSIVVTGSGQNGVTDILLSENITNATTVAQFSKDVVDNNPDYRYGDQISFFLVKQKVNANTEIPYCQFSAVKVILDANNDETLTSVTGGSNGFHSVDGKLGHSGNDGDCAYCWVHSRKSDGKTLVSSQELLSANTKEADYQGDTAFNLASASYGQAINAFLTPDGENTANGGGNSGDGEGGHDGL